MDNILTYCYHYDPQTNKHSLIVARVVQLGGVMTVVLVWAVSCFDVPPGSTRQAHEPRLDFRNERERITERCISVQSFGNF